MFQRKRYFSSRGSRQLRMIATKAAGTMPLGAIAGYVGYASYAGFWKAMRQENKKRMSKAAPCR